MVAETGTLVVVESEGNGRMCLTLPETLISVVGIEKVVPTWRDLEVFLQTLPRSSTAERMNPYTSMWTGTARRRRGRPGALPSRAARQRPHRHPRRHRRPPGAALHPLLGLPQRLPGVRAGRRPRLRLGLPGPDRRHPHPQLRGTGSAIDASLPYASSLCGACYDVCPVAIDIPEVLVHLRERVVRGRPGHPSAATGWCSGPRGGTPPSGRAMRAARWALTTPVRCAPGSGSRARTRRLHPRRLPGPGRAWTGTRDLPEVPAEPFRDWWQRTRGGQEATA